MGTISPKMWHDDKFVELDVHAQLMWCYLLTGHEATAGVPGLLIICPRGLAVALRMPDKVAQKAVGELVAAGMIDLDEKRRVIRVPKAPDYNPPSNPNVVLGWFRKWQQFPECALKYAQLESLRRVISRRSNLFTAWNETFGTVHSEQTATVPKKLAVSQQKLPLLDGTVPPTVPPTVREPTNPGSEPPPEGGGKETETETGSDARETGGAAGDPALEGELQADGFDASEPGGSAGSTPPVIQATNGARQDLLRRAQRLWGLQEELRSEISGNGPLSASQAFLEGVVVCLEQTGATDEEAEHVLRVYQAEALAEPDKAKWFNGQSNWRPTNFLRSVGMPIRAAKGGHYRVTGREKYGKGDQKL